MKAARKKKPAGKQAGPQKGEQACSPSQLNRRKIWCFRLLLALGVPILVLAILELVLRLVGFGYPTGFLLRSERDGQKVLVQNNQFGWRFFGPAMSRLPAPICIPETKGSNTVRIIVFGESAAFGDPQPRFGLARMLQAMLELRYPGVRFEVVNAAMTAINSNVILPIARDCAAAHADVWVLYIGNNEVVGPFGAGTVFGRQTPPLPLIRLNLALKATRTGQFIDFLLSHLHKPPPDKSEWGGMEMFLNQQVRADDSRMNVVYDHFSRNLSDIIEAGRRSGAGIVLSTVGVNLRDSAPFASGHRSGLSDQDKSKWEQLYRSGVEAQAAGKWGDAAHFYDIAAEIDRNFAELQFRWASCELALGNVDDARNLFATARDQDTLRFRCDTRLNELIRKAAASDLSGQNIILADSERAFAFQSDVNLPGSDFFYEHVHLTFDGNYLLARTIAPGVESMLPKNIVAKTDTKLPWPSEADCARRLAWSDWDKQQAFAEIFSRLNNPPFTGQLTHDSQVAKIKAVLGSLAVASQPAGVQAAEASYQNAVAAAPDDALLHHQLAELQELSGDLPGAATNAERAAELLPASSEQWSQWGVILAKEHKYEDAASAFRRAFQLDPEDVWSLQGLAQSLNDLGRRDEAIREYKRALTVKPRFGLAWLGMGQILEQTGHKSEAEDCYQKALRNRINHGPELTTLARFCEGRGWFEAAATNFDDAIRFSPSDTMLYLEAGRNFAAAGRHAEAEQHFAVASQLSPDSMQAHFLYGLELGRDGKAGEAAAQFREAVRLAPNMPEARLNFGMALENAGNYSEALAQFNKVLELNPANAIALSHIQALQQKNSPPSPH